MTADRSYIWWGALLLLGTFLALTVVTAVILSFAKAERRPSMVPDPKVLAEHRQPLDESPAVQEARKRREELAKEQEKSGDGHKLPFTPVTITCINLCYFVPNPHKGATEDLQLLRGITATLQRGTAISA
eukprot:jgi/Ulvmu1/6257/UM028_0115.1